MARGSKRDREPEQLESLVGKAYPWQRQPDEARAMRVFAAFERVASARVQRNAAPVEFRAGVLTVHTVTSSWANALALESAQLLARLRARVPEIPVQRIAFRVGRLPELRASIAEEPPPVPLLPLR